MAQVANAVGLVTLKQSSRHSYCQVAHHIERDYAFKNFCDVSILFKLNVNSFKSRPM